MPRYGRATCHADAIIAHDCHYMRLLRIDFLRYAISPLRFIISLNLSPRCFAVTPLRQPFIIICRHAFDYYAFFAYAVIDASLPPRIISFIDDITPLMLLIRLRHADTLR